MTPFDLVEPRSLHEAAALLDTGDPAVRSMPPAEFAAKVRKDAERYKKVVQDIGLQAQ